jgi:hypothetical protein
MTDQNYDALQIKTNQFVYKQWLDFLFTKQRFGVKIFSLSF